MRCQGSALVSHDMVTYGDGDRYKHAKAAVRLGSLKKETERWLEDLKGEVMDLLGG